MSSSRVSRPVRRSELEPRAAKSRLAKAQREANAVSWPVSCTSLVLNLLPVRYADRTTVAADVDQAPMFQCAWTSTTEQHDYTAEHPHHGRHRLHRLAHAGRADGCRPRSLRHRQPV